MMSHSMIQRQLLLCLYLSLLSRSVLLYDVFYIKLSVSQKKKQAKIRTKTRERKKSKNYPYFRSHLSHKNNNFLKTTSRELS